MSVDDVEGDEGVLQLISLIDSRCRPEGSGGARCKTTGARAEARAVGTTQPLAPEESFGHLGHGGVTPGNPTQTGEGPSGCLFFAQ